VKPNLVSIVIPVYNEEQAIGDDLDLIIKTMEASDYDYEIIVVDDGSTDSSADIVRQRSQVKLIRHPYNRGTGTWKRDRGW
jgi:glycosyltransferase involved in cell wall biosynthesis